MSNEHNAEPWRIGKDSQVVCDTPVWEMDGADALEFYGGHLIAESVVARNARRIVACVNACAGLDTEKLEQQNANGLPLYQFVAEVIAQRDALLAACEKLLGQFEHEIREDYSGTGELLAERLAEADHARRAIAAVKGGA